MSATDDAELDSWRKLAFERLQGWNTANKRIRELQALLSAQPEAGAQGGDETWPGADWKCPNCGWCRSFARMDQRKADGSFGPGPGIRCVECKGEFYPPTEPAGEVKGETCLTCQGNGEVVTDWDRYLHPDDGDVGDEATATCPDCDGQGAIVSAPTKATLWSTQESGNRAFIGPTSPNGQNLAESIVTIDLDPAYGPEALAERRAVARMVVEGVNRAKPASPPTEQAIVLALEETLKFARVEHSGEVHYSLGGIGEAAKLVLKLFAQEGAADV